MKRTALFIAVVGLSAFSLAWNSSLRAEASKNERPPAAAAVAKQVVLAAAQENSKANVSPRSRRRMGVVTPMSAEETNDGQMDDPDLPTKTFLRNVEKEEY